MIRLVFWGEDVAYLLVCTSTSILLIIMITQTCHASMTMTCPSHEHEQIHHASQARKCILALQVSMDIFARRIVPGAHPEHPKFYFRTSQSDLQ